MDKKIDDKMQQSLMALEMQKGYIESLSSQIEMIEVALNEHIRAKETIDNYINLKEGHELLIPIGANSFIYAKKTKAKKAIVGIGAKISVEEDLEKAQERIDEKIKNLQQNGEELAKQLNEVQQQAATLSEKIKHEMGGTQNVQETKRET